MSRGSTHRWADSGRRFGGLVAGVALLAATACDGSDATPTDPVDERPPPGAATYEVAIAEILDLPAPTGTEPPPDPLPVLYLVPIDETLGIEDQAAVIDAFAATIDVRFVDELAAAVDVETPGSPPRDEAIVLGLGPIDQTPPHLVRIEQYRSAADVDATLLTLAFVVDRWVVTAAEDVPAEALTDVG